MAVHFVYRSPAEGPAVKTVRRLEADSVLSWFQNVWPEAVADDAAAWVKGALGCAVHGLDALIEQARERRWPSPDADARLHRYLHDSLPAGGKALAAAHCLQVLSADEEMERAYYFFDDVFLQDNPRSAAFLLHEDWQLPDRAIDDWYQSETPTHLLTPSGSGEGGVFLALLTSHDNRNLTNLGLPYRIPGVRLPELCRWLAHAKPDSEWPFELRLLRSQVDDEPKTGPEALRAALLGCNRFPVVPLTADPAWSRLGLGTLKETRAATAAALDAHPEKQRPNKPKKSQSQVTEHLAQLCQHVGRSGKTDVYHRWILFDDQWAAANKVLANGLLKYARRWDVLSAV